jgi:hypothetical protein
MPRFDVGTLAYITTHSAVRGGPRQQSERRSTSRKACRTDRTGADAQRDRRSDRDVSVSPCVAR